MEERKTKAEEYCKRVDQIIREMDEDRPIKEIQTMIDELSDCEKNLKEVKKQYEEEGKRLFEKNGGGTDSFEALATENMLKKINWVLEEIPSFVELAQTVIDGNSKKEIEMVEETVSKDLPEEDEMPEIDVIKIVPIEPINEEKIQPKTSLDDLPQFFDKDEEVEAESVKGGPFKLGKEILEVGDDQIYSKEKVQEEKEIDLESEEGHGIELEKKEEKKEPQVVQTFTINLKQPVDPEYIEIAERAVRERKDMTDPERVAGAGNTDGRAVLMKIQNVLTFAKAGKGQGKSNSYERERE